MTHCTHWHSHRFYSGLFWMQWGALLLTRLDASQGTESQSHGQRKGGTQHQRAGGVRCGIRFCSHVPGTARAGSTTFMSSRIGRVEAKKRSSTQQKMECGRGCFRALAMLALVCMVAVVVEADPAGAVYGSKPREPVEPWGDDSHRLPVPGERDVAFTKRCFFKSTIPNTSYFRST